MRKFSLKSWFTVAQRMTSEAGIKLCFDDMGARTNGRTIWIPPIPETLTEAHRRKLFHCIGHESNHVLYTDFKVYGDQTTTAYPKELALEMRNIIDDPIIDAKRSKISKEFKFHQGHFWKQNEPGDLNEADPRRIALMAPLFQSNNDSGVTPCGQTLDLMMDHLKCVDEGIHARTAYALEVVREKMRIACSNPNDTTAQTVEIAEDYLNALDLFDKKPEAQDEPENSEEPENGDDENEGDSGDAGDQSNPDDSGNDEGSSEGSNESEDDGSDQSKSDDSNDSNEPGDEEGEGGTGKPDGSDEQEGESGAGESNGSNEPDAKPDNQPSEGQSNDSTESGDNSTQGANSEPAKVERVEFDADKHAEEGDHAGGFDLEELVEEILNDEQYEGVPLVDLTEFDTSLKETEPNKPRHDEVMLANKKGSRDLQYHLEDLLDDIQRTKKSWSDKGRLKSKSFGRVSSGREDVFVKTKKENLPSRHLSILIDTSGSMRRHGEKAIAACGILMPSLDIIDASYSVSTFGAGVHNVKSVDESTRVGQARLGGIESIIGGSTPMAEALFLAIDDRPNTADLQDVLIITDGRPDCEGSVIDKATAGELEGVSTHILSVGIDPNWTHGSNINSEFVSNFDNLAEHLINLIEKILLEE